MTLNRLILLLCLALPAATPAAAGAQVAGLSLVPPGRDDRAYIFPGRTRWDRIVVVSLPATAREAVRRLRADPGRGAAR